MSADEDLYLNQSEAETLFYPDALLGNADELDFESFGDSSGLDDGTFNGITGPSLTSFETRDIFKPTGLNGDSFADEVELKCNPSLIEASTNGTHHCMFNKPTLDLESMGMAYGISGLYLTTTGLRSPSSPSTMSPLLSPSSEKLNGLTLGQQQQQQQQQSYAAPGMQPFASARAMSATTSPVVTQAVPMTRFGSQEVLMVAAERSQSTSPALSPNSSDGKEQVERLIGSETGMKLAQEQKQYYSLPPERGVDSTASFIDQVDGDGDGLQPLPQMTRPSMQRSFSSHALGQLRHMGANAAPASENGMSSRGLSAMIDRSGGLSSPGARQQQQQQQQQTNLAEFQSLGMRPMMRRVYSAGDIQTLNGMQGSLSGSASPSFDDGSYRVGKYSMEERKIRIHRYQQKRTQRNFNKKIKYACRKTLADSRPRVRGRFAKNMDDDVPTAVLGRRREDDDDDEGDAHANGGEANGYHHFDNSLGEYSDMLTRIKVEHRTINSM